ncbi:MAG: hypothetical protein F4022_07240, partial [Gemmatimonadetes bacterium]|nr:hypothetical protein [Gemmatimonadota bacterium]
MARDGSRCRCSGSEMNEAQSREYVPAAGSLQITHRPTCRTVLRHLPCLSLQVPRKSGEEPMKFKESQPMSIGARQRHSIPGGTRTRWPLATVPVLLALAAPPLAAQHNTTNPFRPIYGWGELPEGREWGSTSAVEIALDGNIWVAERCGANTCVGSDVDPILLFDTDGNLLRSFGGGMIAWPHGIDVDHEGNVWVTDAWQRGATTTGHSVLKFSPEGELLMTIGTPGEAGDPPNHLTRPSDVLVAPNGQIYVVDAHDRTRGRVIRYAADGTYMETWGELGYGPGQFRDPHALAMDSQGRIFVGDRYNNRIQVFDQEGEFLAIWTQFGRPSGLYIDADDNIYVADSESSPA